jgi:alanine racemase
MDAITVRLEEGAKDATKFVIMKNDFTSPNSVVEITKLLKTIAPNFFTGLTRRLPRVYTSNGELNYVCAQ